MTVYTSAMNSLRRKPTRYEWCKKKKKNGGSHININYMYYVYLK